MVEDSNKIRLMFLTILIALTLTLPTQLHQAEGQIPAGMVDLYAIIYLRDYRTDMPIVNVSALATIWSGWKTARIGPSISNETGAIQASLGRVADVARPPTPQLQELTLLANYTLIKVCDRFIEEESFEGSYAKGISSYRRMKVNLYLRREGGRVYIECFLWMLEGMLVKVSDRDPFTGKLQPLRMAPALKAVVKEEYDGIKLEYESLYFFPLNYPVTIIHQFYPPLVATVSNETVLINWMYHAAKARVETMTHPLDSELSWLKSLGFPMESEMEDYRAAKRSFGQSLSLFENTNYTAAIGAINLAASKLRELGKTLSYIRIYAAAGSLGIYLLVFCLASLLPAMLFEGRKPRIIFKIIILVSLLTLFSLTQPSMKLTSAMVVEAITKTSLPSIDLTEVLWVCFLLGASLYFIMAALSMRRSLLTELSLDMAMRDLKRRKFRTLATLITLTTVVASAIMFINITVGFTLRSESWRGGALNGIIIKVDISLNPLTKYDVSWIRGQPWCDDVGYFEEILRMEQLEEKEISRIGVIIFKDRVLQAKIVGIDPAFMEKIFKLREYIRGGYLKEGEEAVIISSSFTHISMNDDVTLAIEKTESILGSPAPTVYEVIGRFKVKGKIEVEKLPELKGIDGRAIFEDMERLVLVPVNTVAKPYMRIAGASIIVKRGYDPLSLAEDLVSMFGATAIANANGVATKLERVFEVAVAGFGPQIIPIIIAALLTYVTIDSIYEERKAELKTLATLGLDPTSTFQIIIVESLVLGLLATVLGFFGSNIVAITIPYIASFLKSLGFPTPEVPAMPVRWPTSALFAAFLTGVVTSFLGGYLPSIKTQRLSLLGGVKRRHLLSELTTRREKTSFPLPIKAPLFDGELLYEYTVENLGRFKPGVIDLHSIKGEKFRDGTFIVSFSAIGSGATVFIPFKLKGEKVEDSLTPVVEFPTEYKSYKNLEDILRRLEEHAIAYPSWRDKRLKLKIIRTAPEVREETPEEVLAEARKLMSEAKIVDSRLKELEAMRLRLSEEIYSEFKEKYIKRSKSLYNQLRPLVTKLEPYYKQIQQEMGAIALEMERVNTAHTLGEMGDEEYAKTYGPLERKLVAFREKVKELEELFTFLQMPYSAL